MLDRNATFDPATAEPAARHAEEILPCVAQGLTFEAGGKTIVDGIDVTLEQGPVTMVMGPNGAGKTVLVRLLHGMLEPTAGQVLWAGKPVGEENRKRQAMVFQNPVLLRRSVVSNIEFVLKLRGAGGREQAMEILRSASLDDKANQPARLLSGGERQRLAMARALATDPDVLFLDEPTASLDPASVLVIEDIVRDAHQRGVKIIFITHDLGQARRLADEVIFIHRGKIVERSPAKQFFNAPASREAKDYLAGRIVL